MAARCEARIDALEVVRYARPRERRTDPLTRVACALYQLGVGDQPRQVAGERVHIPGLELEPVLSLGEQLLVGGKPGGHGHDARRQRSHQRPRLRSDPLRGQDQHVGVLERVRFGHLFSVQEPQPFP